MKKIVALILLLSISFFLVACGNGNSNDNLNQIENKLEENVSKRNELESQVSILTEDINELIFQLDSKKVERQKLIDELLNQGKTSENINLQIAGLNEQITLIEKTLNDLTIEKETLELQINSLNIQIEALNIASNDLNEAYEEIESLNSQLQLLNEQIKILNDDKILLEVEKDLLQSKYDQSVIDFNSLQSQVGILNNQINNLTNQKNNLEIEILSLENIIADLESTNNTLQIELNNIFDVINNVSYIVMKSNVLINTNHTNKFGSGIINQGSGIIFYEDAKYYYLLTNNHVVYDDPNYAYIKYYTYDYKGNKSEAFLHSLDPNYDLAILYFLKGSEDLDPLKLSNNDPIIGETVISIGQPKGQINTISIGKVLDYNQITVNEANTNASNVKFDVIKHDSPINHGSSGGVLINTNLEIVGINYAGSMYEENGNASSLSYAVPINKVYEYLDLYYFYMN